MATCGAGVGRQKEKAPKDIPRNLKPQGIRTTQTLFAISRGNIFGVKKPVSGF